MSFGSNGFFPKSPEEGEDCSSFFNGHSVKGQGHVTVSTGTTECYGAAGCIFVKIREEH